MGSAFRIIARGVSLRKGREQSPVPPPNGALLAVAIDEPKIIGRGFRIAAQDRGMTEHSVNARGSS